MDYKLTAQEVLRKIGGDKNVSQLEHCATRLRFTLINSSIVNKDDLKKTPGVMGVAGSGQQCQVIIGNSVIEVYDELVKLGTFSGSAPVNNGPKEKVKIDAVILDFVVAIFQPLIPAIAGAGILKAMLSLFLFVGWLDSSGDTYKVIAQIADATLYFLPILVAYTTASKLKVNKIIAVACVGSLIIPGMTTLISEGVTIFGFTIRSIQYSYQVFPAILCVLFYALMERLWTKISPKPIRVFFAPLMCLVITMPVTLLILGPIGYEIGSVFTSVILSLHDTFGFIAVGLLAAVLPFMVAAGMQKAFAPYAVGSITTVGYEILYLSASLAHNIAESGACFAVAIKTKDKDLRSTAFSAGLSAFFGITEPALYGVTVQNKKVMAGVMIGGGIGGIITGIFQVKAFVAMGPGFAGMAMFVDPDNTMNIVYAFIGFGVSLVASFIATILLFKDSKTEEPEIKTANDENGLEGLGKADVQMVSPMWGEVIAIEDVKDETFAKKILGDGVAVLPSNGELYAPADGTIMLVSDTKHAIAMTLANGAEIIVHIGIDTVRMNGENLYPQVQAGTKVKMGDLLIKFDIEKIKAAGYDITTPIVVTNSDIFECTNKVNGVIQKGSTLMTVAKK
nr:beta-glucoside-specific PTS transporter subunit IIABC [uncultured Clostridium sp.]